MLNGHGRTVPVAGDTGDTGDRCGVMSFGHRATAAGTSTNAVTETA